MREPARDFTSLLLRWNSGDRSALDDITVEVYDELHRLASSLLMREPSRHRLSATALVHEAYLKLVDQNRVSWENRAHFFGAASNIMRRVLVDEARRKYAEKRGGAAVQLGIDENCGFVQPSGERVLWLSEAMDRLELLDARKVRTVEMKIFGGMTNQEIAAALNVSDATVERDWKLARAWLSSALNQPRPTD